MYNWPTGEVYLPNQSNTRPHIIYENLGKNYYILALPCVALQPPYLPDVAHSDYFATMGREKFQIKKINGNTLRNWSAF